MSVDPGGIYGRLAALATGRPRAVMTAALVLSAAALWCWPRLRIEPDISTMLPPDHPHARLASLLESRTQTRRSLLLLVRGARLAERVPEIVASLRSSPFVEGVTATREEFLGKRATRFLEAPLWYLAEERVEALAERLGASGRRAALREMKQQLAEDAFGGRQLAVTDPLGLRWLLAGAAGAALPFDLRDDTEYLVLAGGERAFLLLAGKRSAFDADFATQLMNDVEQRIAALEPGVRFDAFGGYAVARSDAARIRSDVRGSTIVSALLVGLFLAFSMRSFVRPLLVLLPAVLAGFWALPIGGVLFGPLTPISIAAAAVLFGLGVDFAIHYLVHYASQGTGVGHAEAVRRAHATGGPPITIGMLTTAGAFVSLAFGSFAGLRAFGLLLALALVLALTATLLVLPLALAVLRLGAEFARSRVVGACDRMTASPRGRGVAWSIAGVTAVAAALALVLGVDVTADATHLRPSDDPVTETREALEAELGFSTVPVALLADPALSPAALAAGLESLRASGHLALITADPGPTGARRRLVAAFCERTAGWRDEIDRDLGALGFSPEPFRESLDRLARRLGSPAPEPEPIDAVTLDGEPRRAIVAYPPARVHTEPSWSRLERAVAGAFGGRVAVYGTPTLERELRAVLVRDLRQAVLVSGALAVVLVLLALASWRAAALSLVPLACGLALALGFASLLDVKLTLASFVAVPLMVGIGVDDGVHLATRLRGGERSTGATGVAVLRTSVTTMLAFGSLVTVRSPGLASMGLLVVIGVGAALLVSLLGLPALWPRSLSRSGRR